MADFYDPITKLGPDHIRYENPDFLEFCYRTIWHKAGATEKNAEILAHCISYGDRVGKSTQGLGVFELPIMHLRSGNLDIKAEPEVADEGPSYVVIDGNRSTGQQTLTLALKEAMRKASETGVAIALCRNHYDSGCFGAYTTMASDQGMFCMATNNTPPLVAPWGAMENTLSTPPFSAAAPGGKEVPLLCDVAFADVGDCDIADATAMGKPLRGPYIIDPVTGEYTDDVESYITRVEEYGRFADMAAPTAFSSPRIYALNTMVEMLTGIMVPGGTITPEMPKKLADWGDKIDTPFIGASFILVIDPSKFQALEDFTDKSDRVVRAVKGAKKLPGVEEIYLPGERGYKQKKSGADVAIPNHHWESFIKIVESFDMNIDSLREQWANQA